MKRKKETRGGTRQGSGAKPKYSEQTKTVAFRCPLSKVDELKIIVKSKLSEWSVKQQLTASAMSSGGFGTTHFKFRNNVKRKNRTSRTN